MRQCFVRTEHWLPFAQTAQIRKPFGAVRNLQIANETEFRGTFEKSQFAFYNLLSLACGNAMGIIGALAV